MKKLTKEQMKTKVVAWVEELKEQQEADGKIEPFLKKFEVDYGAMYQIKDVSRKDRRSAFQFLYDGELYERIEYYRSDGMFKDDGEDFEAITDGTDWFHESEQPGIEYFVRLR